MREAPVAQPTAQLVARPVAESVEALIGAGARREPMTHTDSKSGAQFERVEIDGRPFVLKHLDLSDDWTLRCAGDLGCGTLRLWSTGLLDQLPDCFCQPIVGVACDPGVWPPSRATSLLMEDVSAWLVPSGDEPIALAQHDGFMHDMAALHARFWNAGQDIDIIPPENRLLELSPWLALAEAALGSTHLVPRLVGEGWAKLAEVAPDLAAVIMPLAWDPSPLSVGLATTPSTFVHGNWKLGNLGTDADGRTVLIDWENPGRGYGCAELAWYLAINSARLPCSKDAAIATYRAALEEHGIDTSTWWERQLALGLLAGLVWFGWEKAFGGWGDELAWWAQQVPAALAHLG